MKSIQEPNNEIRQVINAQILSGGAGGSISGLLYKIIAMNMHYKKRRGTLHLDISQDAQFPKELDKSFFVE